MIRLYLNLFYEVCNAINHNSLPIISSILLLFVCIVGISLLIEFSILLEFYNQLLYYLNELFIHLEFYDHLIYLLNMA